MSDLFWMLLAKQIRVTHHTYNSPHFRPWHLKMLLLIRRIKLLARVEYRLSKP